eukprot:c12938_g4_i4.p1 GENE.c12938_g4_i4~~c12938_g4_i4.p1  ORF type:complete len:379 (-),score=90.74 c12938_g4_i4:263-1399(-)
MGTVRWWICGPWVLSRTTCSQDTRLSHVSGSAVRFMSRCLTADPARRITPSDALKHPWLTDVPPVTDLCIQNALRSSLSIIASVTSHPSTSTSYIPSLSFSPSFSPLSHTLPQYSVLMDDDHEPRDPSPQNQLFQQQQQRPSQLPNLSPLRPDLPTDKSSPSASATTTAISRSLLEEQQQQAENEPRRTFFIQRPINTASNDHPTNANTNANTNDKTKKHNSLPDQSTLTTNTHNTNTHDTNNNSSNHVFEMRSASSDDVCEGWLWLNLPPLGKRVWGVLDGNVITCFRARKGACVGVIALKNMLPAAGPMTHDGMFPIFLDFDTPFDTPLTRRSGRPSLKLPTLSGASSSATIPQSITFYAEALVEQSMWIGCLLSN